MRLDSGQWEQAAQIVAETCAAVESASSALWGSPEPSEPSDPSASASALRKAAARLSEFVAGPGGEAARGLGTTMESELREASTKIADEIGKLATQIEGLATPSKRNPRRMTAIAEGLRAQQARLNLVEDWARVAETTTESLDRALARHFDPHTSTTATATHVVFDEAKWLSVLESGAELRRHVEQSMSTAREMVPLITVDADGYRAAVSATFEDLERLTFEFRNGLVALAEAFGPCTWAAAASRMRWLTGQVSSVRQALSDLPEQDTEESALQLILVIERELGFNVKELLSHIEEGTETVLHTVDALENALVEDVELGSRETSSR